MEDARLAVEIAASKRQVARALLPEGRGHRHGIGEDAQVALGQQEGEEIAGAAAMDDEQVAVAHQGGGGLGNGLLLGHLQHLVFFEGPGRQGFQPTAQFGGGDAAEDLAHRAGRMQLVDVAADGGRGGLDHGKQVADRGKGPVLEDIEHQAVAFGFGHDGPIEQLNQCCNAKITR